MYIVLAAEKFDHRRLYLYNALILFARNDFFYLDPLRTYADKKSVFCRRVRFQLRQLFAEHLFFVSILVNDDLFVLLLFDESLYERDQSFLFLLFLFVFVLARRRKYFKYFLSRLFVEIRLQTLELIDRRSVKLVVSFFELRF